MDIEENFAPKDVQEEDRSHEEVQPEGSQRLMEEDGNEQNVPPQRPLNEGGNEQQPANEEEDESEVSQSQVTGGGAGEEAGQENLQPDDVNLQLAGVFARTRDGEHREADNQPEGDETFDRLEDIIGRRMAESPSGRGNSRQEGTGIQPETIQGDIGHARGTGQADVRQKIEKLRRGRLYMAVVLARDLERGRKNPMAEGKFMRFFKSAAFDTIANVAKATGATNKLVGTYDASYKNSTISTGIKLVSDMIGFVAAVKSFAQKIDKFCGVKGALNKTVAVIGIISDFASMLSKGFGIAQAIVKFLNKDDAYFKKVMEYVNRALSAVTQLGTIITDIKGLAESNKEIGQLKDKEQQKWQAIERDILPRYRAQPVQEQQGAQPVQEQQGAQPVQEQQGAQPAQPGRAPSRAERKERRNRVNELFVRGDVQERDKDQLLSYLAVCRKLDKTKSLVVSKTSSLIGSSIGLAANITYGAKYVGIENWENTRKFLDKATDFGTVGVSAMKIGVDATNSNRKNNEEAKAIKERLWGVIEDLGQPQYGLKGISESLEEPQAGETEAANRAVDKYQTADGRLKEAYVDYGALLKAKDKEDFQKLLLSGL